MDAKRSLRHFTRIPVVLIITERASGLVVSVYRPISSTAAPKEFLLLLLQFFPELLHFGSLFGAFRRPRLNCFEVRFGRFQCPFWQRIHECMKVFATSHLRSPSVSLAGFRGVTVDNRRFFTH